MPLCLLTVEIRGLLRLTTNLIDICYDYLSGVRSTSNDEGLDMARVTDELRELRAVLENLFSVSLATKPESFTRVANELLLRCDNEMSGMKAALKHESGRDREQLPSSPSSEVIGNLTLITTALRDLIGEDQM